MTHTHKLKLSICWTLDSLQVNVHTASESCEGETSTQWAQTVLVGGGVVGGRMHEKRGQQVKLGNMVKIKKETNTTQKERRCEIKNIGEESKAGSTKLASYPISLEVNENSSSDLGNEDEEEAGEVLWGDKDACQFYITTDKRWKTPMQILKQIK